MIGIHSGFTGEHIELFDRVSAVLTRRTEDGDLRANARPRRLPHGLAPGPG